MTTTLRVHDVTCDGCERIVRDALSDVSGVSDVEFLDGEVRVDGDADVDDLLRAVEYAGYEGELAGEEPAEESGDETDEETTEE